MHAGWSIWSSTTFCWHDTPICAIVYHSHTKVQFLTWHQQNSECPRPGRVTLRFITNFCWHQKERCVLVLGVYTVTELLFGCQQKLGINLTGHPVIMTFLCMCIVCTCLTKTTTTKEIEILPSCRHVILLRRRRGPASSVVARQEEGLFLLRSPLRHEPRTAVQEWIV